jgi:enoyl-CoA hydratase/carnithine racemase
MERRVATDDVGVSVSDDFVGIVELRRPPNNHFDVALIRALADAYETLDADERCRAILLCSEGKHFSAGAELGRQRTAEESADEATLYDEAAKLFDVGKPVVAAVQGGAIGGGMGLACSADVRLACPETYFWPNFATLGFTHGFALTVTLPELVGARRSADLLQRARRVRGDEALALGLCDAVVPADGLRDAAHAHAAEIAASAPLAVQSIRRTFRGDLPARIRAALDAEIAEQTRLRATDDFIEGVRAMAERRPPSFHGR